MASFYAFLIYVFVTTFTPGPNNILSMVNGMRYGYRGMVRFLAGVASGFFIVMLASGLLNVGLKNILPASAHWLKIFGAVYMLYLAYHVLRSGPIQESGREKALNSFKFGLTMQFLNVKVILYGLTVFLLFITDTYKDPWMIALFSVFLAAVGFVATSCWAMGGNFFKQLVHKKTRLFNALMAGLLVYTAVAGIIA